jgi:hypothetical protein
MLHASDQSSDHHGLHPPLGPGDGREGARAGVLGSPTDCGPHSCGGTHRRHRIQRDQPSPKGPSCVMTIRAPCLKTERRSRDHRDQTLSHLNRPSSGGRAPQARNQEPVEPHAQDELCRAGRIGSSAGWQDDLLVPSRATHARSRGDRGADSGIDAVITGHLSGRDPAVLPVCGP